MSTEQCACEVCPICKGSGNLAVFSDGDFIPCDCDRGIIEVCDWCRMREEQEHDAE